MAGGLPPLSLYVHFPWCVKKCPYCDFNSHAVVNGIPEDAYVAALIADLETAVPRVGERPISSVFFGGGTPSLLSPGAVGRLLDAFRARIAFASDAEITLEANPGTVETAGGAEAFAAWRTAGVNRLSLGVQSFAPAQLAALGRIHSGDEARRAIDNAARHFDNFNLDLMYALPGQDLAGALHDVDTALAFAPPHLSCYQLTLEPHTAFAAAPPPQLPDDDVAAAMQEGIEAKLAAAGYTHYETSAFAQPGRQCRHNLNYWQFGDYLGIGAGAHGKLTVAGSGQPQIIRQVRWRQPARYLAEAAQGTPLAEEFTVPANELPFEFMMNALRLNQGFAESLFSERCGLPLALIEDRLAAAASAGLLVRGDGRIAPSARGQRFLNRLLEGFLDAP